MPSHEVPPGVRPITRSELVRDLHTLGVRPGGVVMVHTRMSAIGWVVGAADVVVMALLDVLGAQGTLMAYAGWNENPWHLDAWPEAWQRAYLDGLPPFDPAVSESDRDVGRIPERIRTWPGARRSAHPEANVVAIGARADWIVDPHPWDFPQGPGSPLARLVESGGQVLMLGAPLDTITLLHHAEHLAEGPDKRFVERQMPIVEDGRTVWRTYQDIDTSANGAFPYEEVLGQGVDPFELIGRKPSWRVSGGVVASATPRAICSRSSRSCRSPCAGSKSGSLPRRGARSPSVDQVVAAIGSRGGPGAIR